MKRLTCKKLDYDLRFQALRSEGMKITVHRVLGQSSLKEGYRRFRGACCHHHGENRPDGGEGKHVRTARLRAKV
jgi:hypothetical protein